MQTHLVFLQPFGASAFWSKKNAQCLSQRIVGAQLHTLKRLIIACGASMMYHLREPDVLNRLTGGGKKSPSCRRVELSRLLMTCLPPHCLPPLSRQQFNNCSNFACSKGRAALKQALFNPLASNSCLQGMGPSRLRNPRLFACILPLQSCVLRKLKTFLLLPS